MRFFKELKEIVLRFVYNHKRPQVPKAILRKKKKAGSITIPDFKIHHKAVVIKPVECTHRKGHSDQWNRTENPEIRGTWLDQLVDHVTCDLSVMSSSSMLDIEHTLKKKFFPPTQNRELRNKSMLI